MSRPLARAYLALPAELRERGALWYLQERAWITAAARGFAVRSERALGAYAALSPMVTVARCRADLLRLLAGRQVNGLPSRRNAALEILAGAPPLERLRGLKVRAFYLALAGDPDAAVIDRHMARSISRALRRREPAHNLLHRRGRYAHLARALRSAAHIVGIATTELQAALWLAEVEGVRQ